MLCFDLSVCLCQTQGIDERRLEANIKVIKNQSWHGWDSVVKIHRFCLMSVVFYFDVNGIKIA